MDFNWELALLGFLMGFAGQIAVNAYRSKRRLEKQENKESKDVDG